MAPTEPPTHRNDGRGYSITPARLAFLRQQFMYPFFDQGGPENLGDYIRDIHSSNPQVHKNFNFQLPFFGFRFNYTRVRLFSWLCARKKTRTIIHFANLFFILFRFPLMVSLSFPIPLSITPIRWISQLKIGHAVLIHRSSESSSPSAVSEGLIRLTLINEFQVSSSG